MIRVTADSNIYISALHFGGAPDKFLDLARTGVIHLSISDDILAEVTRVLRDKFGWSKFSGNPATIRDKKSSGAKLKTENPPCN